MRQTTNMHTKKFQTKGRMLLLLLTLTTIFLLSACGGSDSEGGGSDQDADAKATPDGIKGVVFNVPDGWTKAEVSKDGNSQYASPDYDFVMGVSSIDDSNLHHFADQEKYDTVEEYYKHCTSPSEDDQYDKDFEDADLLGQKAKVSKIKKDDGYVDIATYCIMDGVMYDFYTVRKNAFDGEGKVKSDIKPLNDEELSIYEAFCQSAKAGDGASLQMEGIAIDGLGEITFDTPEGYKLIGLSDTYVEYENSDGVSIFVSMVDQENVEWYYDENDKPYKSLDDYYDSCKKGFGEEENEDMEIAGQKGFRSKTDGETSSIDSGFKTDKAVYCFYLNGAEDEEEIPANLSKDDISVFDDFLKTIAVK